MAPLWLSIYLANRSCFSSLVLGALGASLLELIFSFKAFGTDFLLVSWEDILHAQGPPVPMFIHSFVCKLFSCFEHPWARHGARQWRYISEQSTEFQPLDLLFLLYLLHLHILSSRRLIRIHHSFSINWSTSALVQQFCCGRTFAEKFEERSTNTEQSRAAHG